MKKFGIFIVLLLLSITAAHAAWQSPTELVGGSMNQALQQITATLERSVISIIFALALLQAAITGIKQIASGDVEKSFGTIAMNVTWVGLALWLLRGAANPVEPGVSNLGDLLYRMQHWVMWIVSQMTGVVEFSGGAILAIGLQAYGSITLAITKAMTTNAVNAIAVIFLPGVTFMTALMTFFISIVIMVSCAYLAIKVFITKIEFAILVAIAPLNAAMVVFAPTRDQAWAPFKGALALMYRVLILGGVVAAIGVVAQALSDYVQSQSWGIAADVWTPLLSAAFAFSLLAFVAHKSDAIASSMASGTSTLGSGDLAGSVAAGVAAGMTGAAALGAAAAATQGGAGVKAMSDVMKNMTDASPVARGANAMRQSLGMGGGTGTPPQRTTSSPPPAPSTESGRAMAKAGQDSIVNNKIPQPAINAGVEALQAGKTGKEAQSAMIDNGADPQHAKAAVEAMQSVGGDGSTAGIGGADATPQKTDQEKLFDAVGRVMDQSSRLNQRVERDSAGVGVNISGHHTD